MRILKVIHAWPPEGRGGTEAHAAQAAVALSARGHQVGVFTRTGRPDYPEYEVTTEWQGNIGITRVNNTFADSWSFPWMYKNQRIHEAFVREVEEFKPDLIHIHHLTGLSTTIIEAAKSLGLPTVMSLHDFWMACPRGQRMMANLHLCDDLDRSRCYECLGGLWPHIFGDQENEPVIVDGRGELSPAILAEWDRHMAYALNLCDLLVAPSAFHKERMLEIPIDHDRLIALPHGMDHAPFAGPPRELKPVERIGFIGSVIPVKGVHILIDAFRKLDRPDLHLDIHGEIQSFHEDATYEARLHELARGASNIHFHGAYEAMDVPQLLKSVDMLVVPSLWWETFCLTIREGLLAGIPVLASDLGAMREALDGEQDGVFFRPGDASDLAERIAELLDDDSKRARLMNRGASVKTLDDYVEELEEVYASATKISHRREGTLTVAPPSFPDNTAPQEHRSIDLASVPWEDIGVAMNQAGRASFQVQTRLPSGEDPTFAVGVRVTGEDSESGRLDLTIDLSPLGDASMGASERAPSSSRSPSPEAEAAEDSSPVVEPDKKRRKRRRRRERAEAVPDAEPQPAARDPQSGPREADQDQRERKPGQSGGGGPRREPDRPAQRRSSTRSTSKERKKTVRRVPAERSEPAQRTELERKESTRREDVPRGKLKTERWSVDRASRGSERSDPDAS